jgi:hypothetical protein
MQTQTNSKFLWGCRECGWRYGHAEGCNAKSEAAKKAAVTRKLNAMRCRKCYGVGYERVYLAESKVWGRLKCADCDGTGIRKDTPVNPFKVGDILTGSWGYDQTNVEFWQVIKATKAMVSIQKVQKFQSSDNGHQARVYAAKDQLTGEILNKRVDANGYVKLYDFGCYLSKWGGGGRSETSFGAGH